MSQIGISLGFSDFTRIFSYCVILGRFNVHFQDLHPDYFKAWIEHGLHLRYKSKEKISPQIWGKDITSTEVKDELKYKLPKKPRCIDSNPVQTWILDCNEDYKKLKTLLEKYNRKYRWVSYKNKINTLIIIEDSKYSCIKLYK